MRLFDSIVKYFQHLREDLKKESVAKVDFKQADCCNPDLDQVMDNRTKKLNSKNKREKAV